MLKGRESEVNTSSLKLIRKNRQAFGGLALTPDFPGLEGCSDFGWGIKRAINASPKFTLKNLTSVLA